MSKQPEALRLAYWLQRDGADCQMHLDAAAAELRRLYEVNCGLLEAARLVEAMLRGSALNANKPTEKLLAAIAKAEAGV